MFIRFAKHHSFCEKYFSGDELHAAKAAFSAAAANVHADARAFQRDEDGFVCPRFDGTISKRHLEYLFSREFGRPSGFVLNIFAGAKEFPADALFRYS